MIVLVSIVGYSLDEILIDGFIFLLSIQCFVVTVDEQLQKVTDQIGLKSVNNNAPCGPLTPSASN